MLSTAERLAQVKNLISLELDFDSFYFGDLSQIQHLHNQ